MAWRRHISLALNKIPLNQSQKTYMKGLYKGRIGRMAYTGYAGCTLIAVILVTKTIHSNTDNTADRFFAMILLWTIGLAYYTTLSIKRLHDIGSSGIFTFLAFIPYINLIFIAVLALIPGDEKANQYGDSTEKPTKAHKVQSVVLLLCSGLSTSYMQQ